MALTESTMMALGTEAPDFELPHPARKERCSLAQVRGEKGTLVCFICNHCPYVKHIENELVVLAHDYLPRGIGIVAISANDALNFPADAPERMAEKAYPFPYLYDESQQVARAYDAACTPDFFLFDAGLRCVYRGQFDDARPGNEVMVTGNALREALDGLIAGSPPLAVQKPSMGCNIKWK